MTGLVGGRVETERLDRMIGALPPKSSHSVDQATVSGYGVGIRHHGDRDPRGHAFWTDGHRAGAIDGAISNLEELEWTVSEVFERLLRAPERTLAALEGPFSIACVDGSDNRALLGTDKIGCRTPYYVAEDGFSFGSALPPLLAILDDPTLNEQGINDLLLLGHMWSDTTLVEGVKAVHPASVVEYYDGEVTVRRYWKPDYSPSRPTPEYFHNLTTAFQRTVDRTAQSVTGDVGLWLSGGLDSRATAAELARTQPATDEFDTLLTYTYDANPGGGVNPRLADEVATALEVPNVTVPLDVDRFLPVLEDAVAVTDGMVKWNTLLNLTATYNIERPPDVLMEGLEGALVGHHLTRHHVTGATSLVESMYQSEAAVSKAEVDKLLETDVDTLGSFRFEATRTNESSIEEAVVDVHFQNYYSRLAHASNPVARSRAGTRVPYADGDFLSEAARLPPSWRMGALPFSNDELIYGVVKPKIRLIRTLDTDLAEIPYERSRLKPTRPYPLHVAGFFGSTALSRLMAKPTYGGMSRTGTWYRNHDAFRQKLDGLLDDACSRPFVNADRLRTVQQRQRRGEADEMNLISAITTLEIWLQNHFD